MKFYELALHRGSTSINRRSVRDLAVYMASPLLIENFAVPGIYNIHLLLLFCVLHNLVFGDTGHRWVSSTPFSYSLSSTSSILKQGFQSAQDLQNDQFRRISTTFQRRFKICLLWFLYRKECSFYTHLFSCTKMK